MLDAKFDEDANVEMDENGDWELDEELEEDFGSYNGEDLVNSRMAEIGGHNHEDFTIPQEEPKNITAIIMKVVAGIIIIGGIVIGFTLGAAIPVENGFSDEYNFQLASIVGFPSIISGLLFLAISEVLTLLFKNLNAQKQIIDLLKDNRKEDGNAVHVADDSKDR